MANTYSKRLFDKSIRKLPKAYIRRVFDFIAIIEEAHNAQDIIRIRDIKAIKGYRDFYRYRIGEYRIGIEIDTTNDTIIFHYVGTRGDFYKNFPPKS